MSEVVETTPAAVPETTLGVLDMGGLPDTSVVVAKPEPPPKISREDVDAQLASLKKDHANPDLRPKAQPETAKLEHSVEVMPDGNGEGEDVLAPEPTQEAAPEATGGKKKGIKNPFARARIVEKERNEAQVALREVQIELARLRAAQEVAQRQVEVAKEDQGPGADAGPVEILMAKVDALDRKMEQSKQEAQQIIARAQAENALLAVDQRISAVMDEAPEVMSGAITHLARVVQAQYEENYPDHTEAERFAMAQQSIQQKKLEWASKGLDPAEQLYRLATTFGYIPPESSVEDEVVEPAKSKQPKKLSPAEEIKAAKERQAATKSLGAIPGRSVASIAAKTVSNTSELRATMDQLAKSGVIQKKPGGRIPFSEMAAQFGIKPVASR